MENMMLKGKTVLLGVTGSIAAYKAANLTSMLTKLSAKVQVVMTKNASQFITPLTFETLSGRKCLVDTFDRNFEYQVEHIALAKEADIVLIAPASANVIGKLANGIADDMLTTTVMACRCPKWIAPAMNTAMYENPVVQDNLKKLKQYGWQVIEPAVGMLACKDIGAGKLPDETILQEAILQTIGRPHDMTGMSVLITAGPTQEALDPVRYLTNHSTGKMGYELARDACRRGARVTLVSGPVQLPAPWGVDRIEVTSAAQMFDAVQKYKEKQDVFVLSAAVADYCPKHQASEKIKKSEQEFVLPLERTTDILAWLGQHHSENQYVCGFAMETEDLIARAQAKREKKKADLIVANSLRDEGAGFGVDTNVVTLVDACNELALPCLSKAEVAAKIWDHILHTKK
jgi:phosphopantothenoylcysteine decarboxylase/phosphopantothenate--cysteine ligase